MLLSVKSKPSERQRGLRFVEDFASLNDVIRNGGTPTGNCVIGKKFVGGSGKYINYPYIPSLKGNKLTVIIEDLTFTATDGARAFRYVSTEDGTDGYSGFYIGNESTNKLAFLLASKTGSPFGYCYYDYTAIAGTTIKNVTFTYDGSLGGAAAVKLYFDGVLQALTYASAIPTTIDNSRGLGIGCVSQSAGTAYMAADASCGKIRISNVVLSTSEILNYSNNSMFTYKSKATVNLPMNMATYDPTGKKVLDVSGNGNSLTLGDGSTATTYPTKLATLGYSFDGGDYLEKTGFVFDSTTPYTHVITITKGANNSSGVYGLSDINKKMSGLLFDSNNEVNYIRNSLVAYIANVYNPPLKTTSATYCFIDVFDGTTSRVYLNNELIYTGTPSGAFADGDSASVLRVGAMNVTGTNKYTGKLHGYRFYPFALNQTQAYNETNDMLYSLNQI